jgi:hypothetical protein
MHKGSFIINCDTLLHVSTLLGHLQEELSFVVTLRLHFTIEWEYAVDCVLRCFWKRELSVVPACSASRDHSIVKCNLSVTTKESSPWRWPSRVETCRSVLRLMIKLSLCICWWLVILYLHKCYFKCFYISASNDRITAMCVNCAFHYFY